MTVKKAQIKEVPTVINEKRILNPKKGLILGGVLLLLIVTAYAFKSQFVKVWVNGKPITRAAYISALESQGGKQILEQMINETLIMDAAATQNITIPPEDVDQEIAKISEGMKTQGQDLNEALLQQGMTMVDLRRQLTLQKLASVLTADKTVVTDEEVAQYITENKTSLPIEKNTPQAEINQMVRDQLEQTKQKTAINTWLADLYKSADIKYW